MDFASLPILETLQTILRANFWNEGNLSDIFFNSFFAMVAGLGFSYAFNPPNRVILGIILLSGVGYFVRDALEHYTFLEISGASFVASFCMGMCAFFVAKNAKVPMEIVVFPALLPLFPGSYGYKSILSLLNFGNHIGQSTQIDYLMAFFNNLIIMISVSLLLVAGALVSFVIFYEQSYMTTRGSKKHSIYKVFRDLRRSHHFKKGGA